MEQNQNAVIVNGEANFLIGLMVRKDIILKKYWRQDKQIQETMLAELCVKMNNAFGITVRVEFENNPEAYMMTGGGDLQDESTFKMYKPSLMTFLHMYACSLLHSGVKLVPEENDIPNVPAAWSHTIFCLASRSEYRSSKEKGLFFIHNVPMIAPLGDAAGSHPTDAEVDAIYTQMYSVMGHALEGDDVTQ